MSGFKNGDRVRRLSPWPSDRNLGTIRDPSPIHGSVKVVWDNGYIEWVLTGNLVPVPAPPPRSDRIAHPPHYNSHPSGVECITVTEHFGFNLGNVIKYIWRAEEKGAPLEDLKKAAWYLAREIEKREKDLATLSESLQRDAK